MSLPFSRFSPIVSLISNRLNQWRPTCQKVAKVAVYRDWKQLSSLDQYSSKVRLPSELVSSELAMISPVVGL